MISTIMLLCIVSSSFFCIEAGHAKKKLGTPVRESDTKVLRSSQDGLPRHQLIVVPVKDELQYGEVIGRHGDRLRVSLGEADSSCLYDISAVQCLPFPGEQFYGDESQLRAISASELQDGLWIIQKFDGYPGMYWAQFNKLRSCYFIELGWGQERYEPGESLKSIAKMIKGSFYLLKE